MTLLEEGLLAMRGCWRLLWRDPAAFEDFNLTVEGFWRSFVMLLPTVVLAYPVFIAAQSYSIELVKAGESPPDLRLGSYYAYLLASVALWVLASAVLARLLGVAQNYVRYIIIYNWMAVPATIVAVIPHILYLATGSATPLMLLHFTLVFLAYLSWYVAKAGLETTALVALVFLATEYALTYGLDLLIR